ncbi:MAG: hypothetical protein Q9159_004956 [Coniocarpon cinnabarinum]
MPPAPCQRCSKGRAVILRPKDQSKLCKTCFLESFEIEIHHTITSHNLFRRGERVAVGASGGKDSTVLASVLKTLNERYDYGLNLILLSIDEGITGYRDDSLETVKRNSEQYQMELCILGYKELYGWTMDEVVRQIGKKGNCTYCGVFRRQALDRGASRLGVNHVVTGHNADDVAETVLMNLLRGDLPRLSRATSIVTESPSSPIKRSKPLKYAYEKEIVLYAHHKKLEYFSTECIYSPEAFRGSARALVKNLEKIRPSAILDLVRSGEDMAKLIPESVSGANKRTGGKEAAASAADIDEEEGAGGCGSAHGRSSGGEMAAMERLLNENERAESHEIDLTASKPNGQNHDRHHTTNDNHASASSIANRVSELSVRDNSVNTAKNLPKQQIGKCERCGYMSSQKICKACALLEGLNKNRPDRSIAVDQMCCDGDNQPARNLPMAISDSNG